MPRRSGTPDALPSNLEAERSVLGSVIAMPGSLDGVSLVPGDFSILAHQRIWSVMLTLAEARVALDHVTIKNELHRRGELDEVGGAAYVASLGDGVPRSTNLPHYAEIVKEQAGLRAVILAANDLVRRAYLGDAPVETLITDAEVGLARIAHRSSVSVSFLKDTRAALFLDLEARIAAKGTLAGVDTGFASLNHLLQGWHPGDLSVIAARPSIGKSTFALNTALAAARAGQPVVIFSLEMKRRQLEYRLLSSISGVGLTRLTTGYTGAKDGPGLSSAFEELSRLPIAVDDRTGLSVRDIRQVCRTVRAGGGLGLVVIDYVQLLASDGSRKGANRNEEITDTSRRLKTLAGELSVPILLLSQLSRANEKRPDGRPKLSDLRDSGALEQDADNVCFLHRAQHKSGGVTTMIVDKQRNGPTGSVNLTLVRETTTFHDGGTDTPDAASPRATGRDAQVGDD